MVLEERLWWLVVPVEREMVHGDWRRDCGDWWSQWRDGGGWRRDCAWWWRLVLILKKILAVDLWKYHLTLIFRVGID